MVKLNLLDDPDESKSSGQSSKKKPDDQTISEINFPIYGEDKDKTVTDFKAPPAAPPQASVPPPPPPPNPAPASSMAGGQSSAPPSANFDSYEDPPVYYDEGSRKMPIVFAIVLLALLILAAVWWIYPTADDGETQPVATETESAPDSQQPPVEPPQSRVPAPLQQQYAKNQSENRYQLNYTSNLMETGSSDVGYSLFVVTSGNLYMSLIAESRDAVATLRRQVKDKFPDIQMNTTNDASVFIDGKQHIVSDISVPLARNVPAGSTSGYTQPAPANITREFTSLAQRHGLVQPDINKGSSQRKNGVNQTAYYANLKGESKAMMGFLEDLVDTYPSVDFTKISISPVDSRTMNGGTVQARLELSVSST